MKCSPRDTAPTCILESERRTKTQAQALEHNNLYFHYNHTVPSKFARWNAKQSYRIMYDRPWQHVVDFYSDIVKGQESLSALFGNEMVRVLVATSIREAAAVAEYDALLKLLDATYRWATAPPAPPEGLYLADVGYTDFNAQNCLIH